MERHGLITEALHVATCAQKVVVTKCSKDEQHFAKAHPIRCNKRSYCPEDARHYAKTKARENYEWLISFLPRNAYVIYLVFTVPDELSHEDDKVYERAVRRTLEQYYAFSHKDEAQIALITKLDVSGDSNPLRERKHINVLTFNVALKREGDLVYFKRLRPYFKVELLRAIWKVNFLRELGLSPSNYPEEWDIHVHYAKLSKKQTILHWLSYFFRRNVWMLYKYLIKNNFACPCPNCQTVSGAPVYLDNTDTLIVKSDTDTLKILALTEFLKQDRRVKRFGFIANRKVRKILKIRPLAEIAQELRERAKVSTCPICHSPIRETTLVWFNGEYRDPG